MSVRSFTRILAATPIFLTMRFQKIIDHKWWTAPDRYLAADCSSFTEEIFMKAERRRKSSVRADG